MPKILGLDLNPDQQAWSMMKVVKRRNHYRFDNQTNKIGQSPFHRIFHSATEVFCMICIRGINENHT